ncbi:putative mitochondrial protein [Cucumis melo var. makuwa]|uniref:Mitochondrial protein n=1 Tax=Cucumis melo var. makuwa TaxID=1194695 RepID=A0A5D3BYW6_CUCMM|nr:putative mitochondrial protein [Cucumis melo var. makuwa]TYK04953.1 putative mitochondrial protein [Cucumis melo var. makuwa]
MSLNQYFTMAALLCVGPDGVKVYQDLEASDNLLIEGWELDSIYIMLAEDAYVDKALEQEKTPKDNRSKDKISQVQHDPMKEGEEKDKDVKVLEIQSS